MVEIANCPLPVDWLDLLEGRIAAPEVARLRRHLASCPQCQGTVERLRSAAVGPGVLDAEFIREPPQQVQPYRELKPDVPDFGQIWLTSTSFALGDRSYAGGPRLTVVLLSALWERAGQEWCDVAPVGTDPARATDGHLVIRASECDLGHPLRLLLSARVVLHKRQLEVCVGSLSATGREALDDELAKKRDPERHGRPLLGPHDRRLLADRELITQMADLGSPFAALAYGELELEPQATQSSESAVAKALADWRAGVSHSADRLVEAFRGARPSTAIGMGVWSGTLAVSPTRGMSWVAQIRGEVTGELELTPEGQLELRLWGGVESLEDKIPAVTFPEAADLPEIEWASPTPGLVSADLPVEGGTIRIRIGRAVGPLEAVPPTVLRVIDPTEA